MTVQDAAPDDLPAIVTIERASFTDPWSIGAFRTMIGQPEVHFVVAREGVAAAVLGYVVAIFAGDEGEIANLAVVGDARRRGVGARLVADAVAEAERRGVGAIYLEVRESNSAARRLYGAVGFEEIGRRRGYYQRPVEDALVLRRRVTTDLT